jgi:hypothetical protein
MTARFAAAPPVESSDLDPGGVGLMLVGGTVLGCMMVDTGRLAAPFCLALDAAAVRAHGYDIAVERTSWRPHAGAGLEVGLSWPKDAVVRLGTRIRAVAAVLRPSFGVEGAGEVHRAAPVTGHLLVGMEVVPGARGRPRE